ncbi:MAG: DNA recombination protein RmuC, partial [Deltaproteobacteria bacterium]|nr:DNA recombination protein RmuC [Deltaproteobacteria bacterium]
MESLSPLTLLLLFLSGLILFGWIFLLRMQALLREKGEDGSLQLMQQQIDQLRVQISQTLDNGTRQVQ